MSDMKYHDTPCPECRKGRERDAAFLRQIHGEGS
jgi:hypothetical protein